MRYETLVPSGTPHKALVDTEFLGYTIPKGTLIVTALNAAMHDPTRFDDPEKFYPERFLDSNGNLSLAKDISLPFGAGKNLLTILFGRFNKIEDNFRVFFRSGKRLCAGETFARNMLFLCATSFLQAFNIRMADGARPIRFDENLTGTIRTPPDHWIEATAR